MGRRHAVDFVEDDERAQVAGAGPPECYAPAMRLPAEPARVLVRHSGKRLAKQERAVLVLVLAAVSGSCAKAPPPEKAREPMPTAPVGMPFAEPKGYLPLGCPAGEHDVRTWLRQAPTPSLLLSLESSLNWSPCTWLVQQRGHLVMAREYPQDRRSREDPAVTRRGRTGWFFGYDGGEWGGSLRWEASKGGAEVKLLNENIVDLLPTEAGFIALTGSGMMGTGSAVEIVETLSAPRLGRSVPLDGAPFAVHAEADGTVLVGTSKGLTQLRPDFAVQELLASEWWFAMPASLTVDRDRTIYVGMRGIVVEVRRSTTPPSETWLFPVPLK